MLRIRDVYPGSWFLPILDPGFKNSNERQGWKKFVVIPFFGAINFTKWNYFIFEMLKKKIFLASFQRIKELLTQKIITKLSKGTGSWIRNTDFNNLRRGWVRPCCMKLSWRWPSWPAFTASSPLPSSISGITACALFTSFHTQLIFWIQNLVFERTKFGANTWFLRDQNLFSYPANVLDPKPVFLETKI